MKETHKIPKLRFPEFGGEWERMTLNNLATKIGDGLHGTPKYVDESEYYFINGNNLNGGKILITKLTNHVSQKDYLKNDKGLNNNTLLISINGTIGNISRYHGENVMLGKSVGYFNFNNDPSFYFHCLQTEKIQNHFLSELTGTTIKNLSLKTLRETKLNFPSLYEQKKIASFLNTVDDKIQQLTRKKSLLEQYKKGVMQKIFKQEIRFIGNDGKEFPEWEKKKLGEFIIENKEKSTVNNQHEVLTSSNKGLIKQSDYFGENRITDRENFGFNVIPNNYITYRSRSDNRKFTFNINNLGYAGIISTYYPVFKISNGINYFFITLLNVKQHYIGRYSVGTSQTVLSMNDLRKIKLKIPSYKEQQKIASFLSSIDAKIEQVNTQLEKTKVFKKGLLQQMFV